MNKEEYGRVNKVFPAHAGVILKELPTEGKLVGVPRACGGDPIIWCLLTTKRACSPRMRG